MSIDCAGVEQADGDVARCPAGSLCTRSGTDLRRLPFERSFPVQVDRDWHLDVLKRRHRDKEALAVSGHAPRDWWRRKKLLRDPGLERRRRQRDVHGHRGAGCGSEEQLASILAPDGRVSALLGYWPLTFNCRFGTGWRERADVHLVTARLGRRIRHPPAVGGKRGLRLVVLRLQKGLTRWPASIVRTWMSKSELRPIVVKRRNFPSGDQLVGLSCVSAFKSRSASPPPLDGF